MAIRSLVILIDYFGRWPAWMPVFLASCAANPRIDWLIHSNCAPPPGSPPNVRFVQLSWQDYRAKVSDRLGIRFRPDDTYSICNVRPAFGLVHEKHIRGYDFFGWGDLDVVYGDLSRHYGAAMEWADVISNDARICSGHLLILRNVNWVRQAFTLIPDWREVLEREGPTEWSDSLDEARLSAVFSPDAAARRELAGPGTGAVPERYWRGSFFKNQWVTPFVPSPWLDGNRHHPETWWWHPGRVTNARDATRDFPYLHFMNFKSARYVDQELYGGAETWADVKTLVDFDHHDLAGRGVEISRAGFRLLPRKDHPTLPTQTSIGADRHD